MRLANTFARGTAASGSRGIMSFASASLPSITILLLTPGSLLLPIKDGVM